MKCLGFTSRFVFMISVLLISLTACKNAKYSRKELVTISVDLSEKKELKLSDYFSSIKFLPLETKENILLPRIYKMKKVKDRYYFITNTPFSEFYIFNEDGRFIKSMNKYGKGPGEYTYLEDFYVTPDGSRIELYDMMAAKNMLYDSTGLFVDEWKHGFYYSNFTRDADGDYWFGSGYTNFIVDRKNYACNLFHFGADRNLNKAWFPFAPEMDAYMSFAKVNSFFHYNDKLSFRYAFCDTIYSIEDKVPVPRYYVDFGEKKLPSKYLERSYKDVGKLGDALERTQYAYNVANFREAEDWVSFSFTYDRKKHLCFYSKTDRKVHVSNRVYFDMDAIKFSIPARKFLSPVVTDESYIFLLEASYLNKIVDFVKKRDKEKWSEIKENSTLYQIYRQTAPGDNPVLMVCKLK